MSVILQGNRKIRRTQPYKLRESLAKFGALSFDESKFNECLKRPYLI